jgi:hypothetical protein
MYTGKGNSDKVGEQFPRMRNPGVATLGGLGVFANAIAAWTDQFEPSPSTWVILPLSGQATAAS